MKKIRKNGDWGLKMIIFVTAFLEAGIPRLSEEKHQKSIKFKCKMHHNVFLCNLCTQKYAHTHFNTSKKCERKKFDNLLIQKLSPPKKML